MSRIDILAGHVKAPAQTESKCGCGPKGLMGDIEDLAATSDAPCCSSGVDPTPLPEAAKSILMASSCAAAPIVGDTSPSSASPNFKVRSWDTPTTRGIKPIRTAAEFRASLRGRNYLLYNMGEKVPEFCDEPVFEAGINAMVATYELGDEDPSIAMASSKISGVKHSRFSHITESVEDVVAQNTMQRKLGQRTGTCFQRCVGMDAMNATFSTTYDIDQASGTDYHKRFVEFVKEIQTQNLVVSGAMTDPKGNRDKGPAGQEDPDMFVRVVGRTAKGVIIRGCKVHQTGTLNSHWMLVMPGQRLSPKEKDYGICVALPTDADGITYIHGRQPADLRAHFQSDNKIDLGNAKYAGQEVVVVFDDVFCPFSHVFMDGEIDYVSPLVERFTNYHRRSYICKAGLGDVLLGAAATMAEYNGAAKASHVKDKLVEMAYLNENIAGTALAASHKSVKEPAGNYVPDAMFANVCKHNVTRFPYLTARIAQDLAGGLLVTLPHDKDFNHPVTGPLLEKYLKGAPGTTVENRRRMLRLIENMTMGRNCVGYMAESMHGAGSPQAQRVIIQRLMDPKKKMEFAKKIAGITK